MGGTTQSTASETQSRSFVVCSEDPVQRERIASVAAAGGHQCVAQVEALDASAADDLDGVDCLVLAAGRLSGKTLKAVALVRQQLPEVEVVVACDRGSGTEVRRMLERGAAGVVSFDRLDEVLPTAISAVCAGQVCVPARQRASLGNRVLTTREKQILGLVVMGMSNAQIATKLYLAESTIKSHLSSAFAKLGVASRSEAASVILDPKSGAGLGILTIPTK